jgi:hypothetical protein
VTDTLPAGATFVSGSSGCTASGSIVTCVLGSLATSGKDTVTINVKWNASGAVYDTASVNADQINSAPAAEQMLAFGTLPVNDSDGPIPPWAYVVLAGLMWLIARRRLHPQLGAEPGLHP